MNRLEDLFSLVRFLKVEPWSNFSFWKTFITVPFEAKEFARALNVVQTVLEPLVLRRTKDMKTPDGEALVPLPPRNITIEEIELSKTEREVYDLIFTRAKRAFNEISCCWHVDEVIYNHSCADHAVATILLSSGIGFGTKRSLLTKRMLLPLRLNLIPSLTAWTYKIYWSASARIQSPQQKENADAERDENNHFHDTCSSPKYKQTPVANVPSARRSQ